MSIEGAIAAAYGLALPYRVLLTFDSEAAMRTLNRPGFAGGSFL